MCAQHQKFPPFRLSKYQHAKNQVLVTLLFYLVLPCLIEAPGAVDTAVSGSFSVSEQQALVTPQNLGWCLDEGLGKVCAIHSSYIRYDHT
mmetsp:Transcript_117482/g.204598  ORF Transcript_117482/g.204598 Transcript_117482/m.204598 type:complete len:90 (-) Transcript_117482:319-588(-)